MPHPRNAKLADQIKVILASTLERRVKDPRLGGVPRPGGRRGATHPAHLPLAYLRLALPVAHSPPRYLSLGTMMRQG